MSYSVWLDDSKFKMKAENVEAAFKKVKAEFRLSYYDVEKAVDFEDVFGELGYNIECNDRGDIIEIERNTDCFYDEEERFFSIIAEFTESDSKICLAGEDFVFWRYSFRNGSLKKENGKVTYPNDVGIDLPRALDLLHQIVEHECAARKCSEAIEELLRIGFTAEELADEFLFSKNDVDAVLVDMKEGELDNE